MCIRDRYNKRIASVQRHGALRAAFLTMQCRIQLVLRLQSYCPFDLLEAERKYTHNKERRNRQGRGGCRGKKSHYATLATDMEYRD